MRPLIVCCDGTWQSLTTPSPTNVSKLAQAIVPRDGQPEPIIYYHSGVGTGSDLSDRYLGGGLGKGLDDQIQFAYEFLCFNYRPGDAIYLFGFSRGAYTVRSLAGLIHGAGLLRREQARRFGTAYGFYRERLVDDAHRDLVEAFKKAYCVPKVEIELLACFDTVGSLGIPDILTLVPVGQLLNANYKFHDVALSSLVKNALHACAADERRNAFALTPMVKCAADRPDQVLHQRWFPGDHSSIGGGNPDKTPLSNLTLHWMDGQFGKLGFPFRVDFTKLPPPPGGNPLAPFVEDNSPLFLIEGSDDRKARQDDEIDESVRTRWNTFAPPYRPKTLAELMGTVPAPATPAESPLQPAGAPPSS